MEEIAETKITTINKAVTKEVTNQADKATVRVEIYKIDKGDNAATCRLYDKDDNLIAGKRVYFLDKIPCDKITAAEEEILFPVAEEPEAMSK